MRGPELVEECNKTRLFETRKSVVRYGPSRDGWAQWKTAFQELEEHVSTRFSGDERARDRKRVFEI